MVSFLDDPGLSISLVLLLALGLIIAMVLTVVNMTYIVAKKCEVKNSVAVLRLKIEGFKSEEI